MRELQSLKSYILEAEIGLFISFAGMELVFANDQLRLINKNSLDNMA